MANLVDYTNVNWKDYPNTDTPVTATNLNIMDNGIKNNASAINSLKTNLNIMDNEIKDNASAINSLKTALDSKVSTSDTIAIAHGGTGTTNAAGARTNLGFKSGYTSITNKSSTANVLSTTVALPEAFDNTNYSVVCTLNTLTEPTNFDSNYDVEILVTEKTTQTFKIVIMRGTGGYLSDGTWYINWIAMPY